MSADADTAAMLAEMGACAHRLGMAFGRAAEATEDVARKIELFGLFDRAFFSFRVAIALKLRLRREAGPVRTPPRAAVLGRETEALERESLETEPIETEPLEIGALGNPDRFDQRYAERDRDREIERASLPLLLRTLEGVCADAAALPGPQPAELPALRELLDRMKPGAAPAASRPVPRPPGALRARLAGSAMSAAQPLALAAAPPAGHQIGARVGPPAAPAPRHRPAATLKAALTPRRGGEVRPLARTSIAPTSAPLAVLRRSRTIARWTGTISAICSPSPGPVRPCGLRARSV